MLSLTYSLTNGIILLHIYPSFVLFTQLCIHQTTNCVFCDVCSVSGQLISVQSARYHISQTNLYKI